MAMLTLFALLVLAQISPAPSSTPSASPSPSPTPVPIVTVGGDFTVSGFHTNGVNATGAGDTATGADIPDRADLDNLVLNLGFNAGKLHATATTGVYSFPTVGFALNPDTQTGFNTRLYSNLPLAAVQYNFNSDFSVAAGKFGALLGQESPFTFQNINIQRGLAWSMEPAISRGVQASYTNGPWTLTAQENDAYYSGHNRAFEGLIGFAPSSNTSLQFAAIVPGANTPPNFTVAVGNKAEYDLMFTRTIGKAQFLPYILWVTSPSSSPLGYTKTETAAAYVFMGTWTFSPQWLIAARYENVHNSSATSDLSPNADLIGYGAGSAAQSITVTPTYHFGNNGVLRLEFSNVHLTTFTPGLGFGTSGNGSSQSRLGFEFGVMH